MNFKIKDLMQITKEPFRRGYWKITFASFLMILMSAGVSYSTLIGSVNEIPELIQNVIYNEFSGNKGMNVQMIAVLLTMVGGLLLLSCLVKLLLDIFLENPLAVGADRMMIMAMDPEKPIMLSNLAHAFDSDYLNTVKVVFLKRFFTDMWCLLLIIPGIIKGYEYMLIPYLLAENPYQTPEEVFKKSKQMMRGYKRKAFLLDLYFIPWSILGFLTMGIMSVFYVAPKKNLVTAAFYLKIKEINKGENE